MLPTQQIVFDKINICHYKLEKYFKYKIKNLGGFV